MSTVYPWLTMNSSLFLWGWTAKLITLHYEVAIHYKTTTKNMKIRLFIAIDLPEEIIDLISGMGRGIPTSRPVKPEQLHLTLRFIGEINHDLFFDIREQLQQVRFEPLTLSLQGVGHFPPRGKARVIWVGVAPIIELAKLKNRIDMQLGHCGLEPERRRFSPHITLARLKNPPMKRVMDYLAGNSMLTSPEFTVESFHLYSSHLTKDGAIHTIESSYPTT